MIKIRYSDSRTRVKIRILAPFADRDRNVLLNLTAIAFTFITVGVAAIIFLISSKALFTLYISVLITVVVFYVARRRLPADTAISCSSSAIKLPASVSLESGIPRTIPWSSIKSLDIKQLEPDRTDVLVLEIGEDKKILLDIFGFKRSELQKLLDAIRRYAPDLRADRVMERLELSPSDSGAVETSFTRLWTDALGFHTGNTAFVPLAPNTTLNSGRVKIRRLIAAGGMAAVYLAVLRDGQPAVVKEAVLPPTTDTRLRDKALELFEREAKILADLNHPQIARVYDCFVENKRHYILLQFINGRNLRQIIREDGAMEESRAVECIRQLTGIIAYLHERQPAIIHRDISPDNVIIDESGTVRLIDFGAANTFVGTATRTLVGKQAYMSPEQCKGRTTPLSDLYSIGATLSFLLSGADPVPLKTAHPARSTEGISAPIENLVERLTARDPEDRPQSARALLEELST
ncbi:MAG: serine/threonine protein kinase [Cyanobacteria bacterium HKST-UBA02]|nr:serine/threonine protein kinase [Cyanobacteria bacterium HKST-UBA02]